MLESITPWDANVLHAIHDALACPALDALMAFFTHIGSGGALWIAIALVLAVRKSTRIWGIGMLVTLAAVGILGEIALKHLVMRPRPPLFDPMLATSAVKIPASPSFPSMHAGSSFAGAAFLAFVPIGLGAPNGAKVRAAARGALRIAPFALAAVIAFSRLYFAVHFPTDVAAGIVLGMAVGIAGGFATRAVLERKSHDGT